MKVEELLQDHRELLCPFGPSLVMCEQVGRDLDQILEVVLPFRDSIVLKRIPTPFGVVSDVFVGNGRVKAREHEVLQTQHCQVILHDPFVEMFAVDNMSSSVSNWSLTLVHSTLTIWLCCG